MRYVRLRKRDSSLRFLFQLDNYPKKGYNIVVEVKRYRVIVSRKVLKNLRKIPANIQLKFDYLADTLRDNGPVANTWHNYSKLGENTYHCHLAYHWVACWICEKDSITIEVYYVGSRENAPY